MTLFYSPNIDHTYFLPEEESLHCAKVLRLKAGDTANVFDGMGGVYKVEIEIPHPKRTQVRIIEKTQVERPDYRVHIAIAPTKNIERMAWFLEKVTEIGIDDITPIVCRFSERRDIKHERLEKILIAAAKQSQTVWLPELHPLCSFDEFLKNSSGKRFIAHCYDMPKEDFCRICPTCESVTIFIGPEGDFSEVEVQNAIGNGCIPVSLGQSRLRTETAGVVACHTVQLLRQLL